MKSIKKKIIATTPIEILKFGGNKDKIIVTGEWCNENNGLKNVKNKIETIRYPFENKSLKKQSYYKIINLYEILLIDLVNFLNKEHKVKYTKDYWEQIIGVWLLEFLIVAYEKFLIVKRLIDSNNTIAYKIFEIEEAPSNSVSASNQMNNHQCNNQLFCYFIEKLKKKIVIKKFANKSNTSKKKIIKELSFKAFLKQKIIRFISAMSMLFRKKGEIFILTSYLSFFDELNLQLKVNKLLKFNTTKKFIPVSKKTNNRKINFKNINNKSFSQLIRPLLIKFMPKSFLEDYKELVEFSRKLPWKNNPKKIFTSVNNLYDDTFKIWCAENKRKYKTRLLFCCHGGGFQTQIYSTQNYFLNKTCDKILVWGKSRDSNKKVKTLFNLKSASKPFEKEKLLNTDKRKILIVQDMPTLYTNLLFSSLLHFSEYKDFVELQKKIFKNLKNEIRRNVVIRLGSSYNFGSNNNLLHYEKEVWNNGSVKFNIETRANPIHESVRRSYVVVLTQASSTTLLECISSNIPFLIFCDLKNQLVNSFFKKTLLNLKNKIFFDDPKKISNFLNRTNADEITKWWYSEGIQRSVKYLNENFAIYKKNAVDQLAKELQAKT
tara:strand:+ start:5148 stop:6956 length:1809 start_codon:yes stop_codon:yes gene_type:complete